MPAGVVIVGGGQAGYQTAASLRTEGYDGPVFLIGEEPGTPYQRPPLSKAFVLGKQNHTQILLRPESYYQSHQIELLAGEKAITADRTARKVRLESGGEIAYDTLVLALGARNRPLPVAGTTLEGVCYLRTLAEAIEVKQRLEQAQQVVIIGGGFIGLEIAASARILGKPVTVIEALPRLMARVVAPVVSDFYLSAHTAQGVEILLNSKVEEIQGGDGKVEGVLLTGGRKVPADLVVIGIGIMPKTELAEAAGLPITNGIATSEFLRTPDERIFAIGDCAEHPSLFVSSLVRLESVQNAVDQGVCVARALTGRAARYSAVPWFWSDQFDIRLQMAGLPAGHDHTVLRGVPESGKFSVFYFRQSKLCAVDSVNRPADHLAARKLIAAGTALTPAQAADESVNLKSFS
ncbi:MAG TPA: FAD-dependent oxidoreductase [Bryobacteraceae bacterium]|jgi:3-phenylpropionate/trans-cinnamate dioxygenase ferredoxin reductase subunit